jgi:type VI secretion system (T6SS) phospholipase Tle1-like effector
MIGAIGGIPKQASFDQLETIWNHYRKTPEERKKDDKKIKDLIYPMPADRKPIIKCVGVWDTVGSYGIPAGLGLGALARKLTSWTQGFHDNEISRDIEYGLHAMAIDEARRAFPATAWVTTDPQDRQGVEQVWFAGAHSNVGGGYKESGLSDLALIWMIARVTDQTGLEFDDSYIKDHFWPCAACSLYRSNRGWLISGILPFSRPIPEYIKKPLPGAERLINAKVHWSVMERLGRPAIVDEKLYLRYRPKNLPKHADPTEHTKTETGLIELCRGGEKNKRRDACALHRKLPGGQDGWLQRWRTRRLRQFQEEWTKDTLAEV